MTIKILLLSPYHFVLHYVMLCDHVTIMRTGTERGGSSIWKVKIPYDNSFLTTQGHPALCLDDHKKPNKIRYCKLVSLFLVMSHCLPNAVILRHSFVRRLKRDLNAAFYCRANTNFELSQSASIHLGVRGRTVEKLKKFDLLVLETFKACGRGC